VYYLLNEDDYKSLIQKPNFSSKCAIFYYLLYHNVWRTNTLRIRRVSVSDACPTPTHIIILNCMIFSNY